MDKLNCWEFKKCGRQPGGTHVQELGVCPAAVQEDNDGTNQGKKAGRLCWAVAGTLCEGEVQGTFASKLTSCLACKFYRMVEEEEAENFTKVSHKNPGWLHIDLTPGQIKKYIFPPVVFVSVLMLAITVFGIIYLNKSRTQEIIQAKKQKVERFLPSMLFSESKVLSSQLELLLNRKELQQAWQEQDREKLQNLSQPIYDNIQSRYKIGLLTFYRNDQTSFLRMHSPDRYGDFVDRFVVNRAVQSQSASQGLELGSSGILALRVIHPWFIAGELSGYVELAINMEQIIHNLKLALNTELYIIIDKKHITKAQFQEAMTRFEKKDAGLWDLSPHAVVLGKTVDNTTSDIESVILDNFLPDKQDRTLLKFSLGNFSYWGGYAPLIDASDNKLGKYFILIDATDQVDLQSRMAGIYIAVSIFLISFIVIFFYAFLNLLQQRLTTFQQNMEEEIEIHRAIEHELLEKAELERLVINHYHQKNSANSPGIPANELEDI